MIRPLRVAHRRAATALAVALPILLGLVLASRQPIPTSGALASLGVDAAADAAGPGSGSVLRREVPGEPGIVIRRPVDRPDLPPLLVVELLPDRDYPELLAYWVPPDATAAGPAGGYLLGPLPPGRATRFALPEPARDAPGSLLLYSLAESSVVASISLGEVSR